MHKCMSIYRCRRTGPGIDRLMGGTVDLLVFMSGAVMGDVAIELWYGGEARQYISTVIRYCGTMGWQFTIRIVK